MLLMIGNFKFEVNETDFDEYKSKLTFGYVTHENFGSYNSYQATGKFEQEDSLKGTLICKSQTQLKAFEDMGKRMEAQTLASSNGEAYSVLIFSVEKTKSNFLKSGEFLRQSYSINLQRIGE